MFVTKRIGCGVTLTIYDQEIEISIPAKVVSKKNKSIDITVGTTFLPSLSAILQNEGSLKKEFKTVELNLRYLIKRLRPLNILPSYKPDWIAIKIKTKDKYFI
jgi:hypothetical protein